MAIYGMTLDECVQPSSWWDCARQFRAAGVCGALAHKIQPLLGLKGSHCHLAGKEAFDRGTIGQDNLMPVKRHVIIADWQAIQALFNAGLPQKTLGGHKNLALTEHALRDA